MSQNLKVTNCKVLKKVSQNGFIPNDYTANNPCEAAKSEVGEMKGGWEGGGW